MRRIVLRVTVTLIVLVGLVLVVLTGGYLYLRESLPVMTGEIRVEGISKSVDIVRDADDIPHIYAETKADALFGLGYVHAQDRLWQMEFQRRIGYGRLSEIFGAATIPQDRFLRTVGFGRAANSAWTKLPQDVRDEIDAYLRGVNTFITRNHGRFLPPEFTLLRFEPEPFTGPDVLVWVKMMAWDLSGNYSLELMRHDILAAVGEERMADLLPPYPADGLNIVQTPLLAPPKRTQQTSARTPAHAAVHAPDILSSALALARVPAPSSEGIGSNNWVVDGTMTASGKPMLANDPHLSSHVPSLWYLAHMTAGDFDVIGATLPGAPAVALGRNKYIAWGATNVAADVQDLYQEQLDASGTYARFRGHDEPITVVREQILVKGAAPIDLNVRITRHGPLVSDAINANNAAAATTPSATPPSPPLEPLALRWTTLDPDDSTVMAFMRLNDAKNWTDFTGAMRELVAPSQNFVYADVDGHIGYYAPGRIPVRAAGDGSRPVEGWEGQHEWTGFVPFDALPHAFDPQEHFIVTANNRPLPANAPYFIGMDYPDPWRAQRITDLLGGRTGLTADDFRTIQADTLSLHAKYLVPLLLGRVKESNERREALDTLRRWNFDASADSVAESIFEAWFLRLAGALAGDELGPVLASYEGRFSYVTRFVAPILERGASPWCDNVTTPEVETCEDAVTSALDAALADLHQRTKRPLPFWRWDAVHHAVFPHQGLDSVGLLRPFLSRSMPSAGDWSTVNVGSVATDALYEQHAVPGYRQIVDLSPANDSRFADAVGESGHFLSPHYDDYLSDWQAVRHRKMRMDREEIEDTETGYLRLTPVLTK
ncbi:MAG: penicillin acylase family protein [Acidobacteriaceae bacterium]|jgi:penicillin amidase|nr:penicillin acylase family protein [Acidobacteriaceae bacterium]